MIIDVSHHNGVIDWSKIKNNIDGAIIRLGYGDNIIKQDDKHFFRNVESCIDNNIPFGFYLYSYATKIEQFNSEMQHIMRLATPYLKNMTLPIFYDLEEKGTESFSNVAAQNFCNFMRSKHISYGLYASESWFNNYINLSNSRVPYLWVAKYSNTKPDIGEKIDIWQYTDNLYISGLGPFDGNKVYTEFTGLNTTPNELTVGALVSVIPDKIEGNKKYVVDTNGKYNRIYFDKYTVSNITGNTVLLEHNGEIFTRVLKQQVNIIEV